MYYWLKENATCRDGSPLPEEVPLEETLAALEECKAEGKIKHIGVCNFGVEDLKRALATGTKIVSNQICYNLLWRGIEDEVVPFCIENDIAILPWSPMGQGLLTGKVSSADEVQPGRTWKLIYRASRDGWTAQDFHQFPELS